MLKPNVSAIVAGLYPEGGARLDSGFTVFYIGINVGGVLGPFVTGLAQVYFGLRAGFAAAAFFMAVGVVQFYFTRRHLGSAGAFVAAAGVRGAGIARQWLYLWVAVGLSSLLLAAVGFGWIQVNPVSLAQAVTYVIAAMVVLYFLYYFSAAGLTPKNASAASCSWCCSSAASCSGRATNRPARA